MFSAWTCPLRLYIVSHGGTRSSRGSCSMDGRSCPLALGGLPARPSSAGGGDSAGPTPASCQKLGVDSAPQSAPGAGKLKWQNSAGWHIWHRSPGTNCMLPGTALVDRHDGSLARGSLFRGPRELRLVRIQGAHGPHLLSGGARPVVAPGISKGPPATPACSATDGTVPEFGRPAGHIRELDVWLLGLHAAVWQPSPGCPLGHHFSAAPRLLLGCSLGWRGTARLLHTPLPTVVRPSTQLGFGVRFLVSGPVARASL